MKKSLYLMYLISFLQGLVFYAPVSLIYRTQRGLSVGEFFILDFISLIIVVLTEVPWGYFSDRFGYKKTLLISYILFFLGRVSLLFCNNFLGFLLQTIVTALAISATSGCDIAYLYNICEDGESEKVFGRYKAFSSLAFFIASISSILFIKKSIEFAIVCTIIAYGFSVILICFVKEDNKECRENKKNISIRSCIKQLKHIEYIFLFVICIAIINELSYAISVNLGQLQFQNIGMSIIYLGYINASIELVSMLSFKTHVITNKFSQEKTLKVFFMIMLLCILGIIITNNIAINIICIVLIGGLIGVIEPIILDIKNKSIVNNRATMLSIYSMVGSIVTAFSNIAIGIFADIYLKYAFIFCFFVMLVSILGVYLYIYKISYNKVN